MSRAVLILLVSWAYVGCAARAPESRGPFGPRPAGGIVRLLASAEHDSRLLRASLLAPGENGSGPFIEEDTGLLVPNPAYAGPGPYVEAVQLLPADDTDPALLLRLGEADVGVLYGRPAGSLLDEGGFRLRLARAPGWDRTYFLWLGAPQRWTNDPAFRRWLAGAIDRGSLLRFLFDGRGVPAHSLSVPGPPAAVGPRPVGRPFDATSVPRLLLGFDGDDPHARSVAARLKAALDAEGLVLTIEPQSGPRLEQAVREGRSMLALLAHRPQTADVVHALRATFEILGPGARPALAYLEQAARLEKESARTEAAWLAEDALLLEAKLVPLIRLHAWVATDRRLQGVVAGPYGVLRLEKAWWKR